MTPPDIPIPAGPGAIIFRYIWVAFIIVTWVNARIAWHRSVKPKIEARPELEEGYQSLYRGSVACMSLPWALMGVGILSGRVSVVHEYLMPSAGNQGVLLWWGAMGALAVWGTFWMFSGGAERLAEHPGLMYVPESATPKCIKLFWVGGCVWNGFFAALLFSGFPFNLEDGNGIARLVPAIFPFFFVGMWLFVSFILGQMSGWAGLAEVYPQKSPYAGPLVSTSGKMGMTRYSGVLRLGADEKSLHLSVLFLFRVGHAPLTIPWSSIRVSSEKIFFTEYVRLQIDQTILDVRKKDVERLSRKQKLPRPLEKI